jgi:AraC-like DNA-binding protein
MSHEAFRLEFVESLDSLGCLEALFENLPSLQFWIKDLDGRFVTANQNVVKSCRCRDRSEVIGKTDFEFFPKHIAEGFRRDDLEVARSGIKIQDRIEPITHEDGSISWYSTNKVPLYSRQTGQIIGVAGTTRRLDNASSPNPVYAEFSAVIEYINQHFAEPIEIAQLARMLSLSLSQFERRFKLVFQETPVRFILKIRINEACRLLVQTRYPLAHIARATGFFDQSYFSKQFSSRMGTSPRAYREKYYQGS